jgi:integrase/recombinase XerD
LHPTAIHKDAKMTNYDPTEVFNLWIREKELIDRCSPKTIESYHDAWKAFTRYGGTLDKTGVKTFVLNAVNAKRTPRTINSYSSAINSFLHWLNTEGYLPERLRIPLQPVQKKVLPTYSVEDAQRVLNFKPRTNGERRLSTILHLIADCGLRIDEILSLPRTAIDWTNCLITVTGKGSKVRIVPVSLTCRSILFKWEQRRKDDHPLMFCTSSGRKLSVHNLRRDLVKMLDWIGVEKPVGSFHTWRRLAAKLFVRSGGDVATLSRILGHSKVSVTMDHYLEDDPEALRLAHRQHSPLDQLKR